MSLGGILIILTIAGIIFYEIRRRNKGTSEYSAS